VRSVRGVRGKGKGGNKLGVLLQSPPCEWMLAIRGTTRSRTESTKGREGRETIKRNKV
jgi:hypothetical protein